MAIKSATRKQGVVISRKGGGTLINNRPVFSSDSKYVYVNCGWVVRVFSLKTGECVRTLESPDVIVGLVYYNKGPLAVTAKGYLIKWKAKSDDAAVLKLELVEKCRAIDVHLVPNILNPSHFDICVPMINKSDIITLIFYDPLTGNVIPHCMNNSVISYCGIKHNISFGAFQEKPIYASVVTSFLNICSIDGKESFGGYTLAKERQWTCVRCHQDESIVAAGDSAGRVLVWRNPFHKSKMGAQCIYHWHTLPCQDIALTPAGSIMYTGGGEHVLVKWNIENPNIRHYLPRLSAEIMHITVSADNLLVAVSTLDNGIQIIESQNKLRCVLQQLVWGVIPTADSKLFPAGLNFDRRTGGLVLNGRPGHLQFYSPQSEILLFNVDITQRNILTQERAKVITNTEVTHCSLSSDGAWMASIETRNESGTALELRLKIWQFIPSKQRFSLNTSVEKPHNGLAFTVQFKPGTDQLSSSEETNLEYMLVTTGGDKKFRIWTPSEIDSVHKKGIVWGCGSTGFYRDKDCGVASFSEDGSLLAVSFAETLTIWDIDNINIKTTLTRQHHKINFVQFGREECCHLVTTATDNELSVWNLLNVTLLWHITIQTSILVSDPCSSYQAVFTKDCGVFIFTPLSPEPIYTHSKIDYKYVEILAAVFIPRGKELQCDINWLRRSQLYYINSNQELKAFELEGECHDLISVPMVHDKEPGTLFSSLIASNHSSNIIRTKKQKHLQFGVLGASAITELLMAPAHTMPPISLLCSSLLQSLVLTKNKGQTQELKMDICDDEGIADKDLEGSSESESEDGKQKSPGVLTGDLSSEVYSSQTTSNHSKPFTEKKISVGRPEGYEDVIRKSPEKNTISSFDTDLDDDSDIEGLEFFKDVKGDINNFMYE